MFVSAFLLYPNFGLTTFFITTHLPFFSLSYRWRGLVGRVPFVPPHPSPTFYNPPLVTTFPFSRRYILFFPSLHSPFEGSQRQLGMCKGGGFFQFSVTTFAVLSLARACSSCPFGLS